MRASSHSRGRYFCVPAFNHGMPIHRPDSLPILLFLFALIAALLSMAPRQTHVLTVDLPHPTPAGYIGVLSPSYDRITMDAAGILHWNGTVVDQPGLAKLLMAKAESAVATPLLLTPDQHTPYGSVARVLVVVEKVGLVDHCFRFSGNARFARFEEPATFAGHPSGEAIECMPVYGY